MGKLDRAVVYLSGAMEYVADDGVEWRREFIKQCLLADLYIDFIDPTDKPGGEDVMIDENKALQIELQSTGQFKELQKRVNKFRRYDLGYTDQMDFMVTMISPGVAQWGTANEVYVGETNHRPNFFICPNSMYELPRWLFGVIDEIKSDDPETALRESNVYGNVESVVAELIALDRGEKPLGDEWILVRKDIEDRRERNELLRAQLKSAKLKAQLES